MRILSIGYTTERFFEFDRTSEEAKLWLVVILLEGKALQCHRAFILDKIEEEASHCPGMMSM